MNKYAMEKEIKRQMAINKCSYEEAKSIVEWDYEIDHGNKELGAITKEQKKMIRSITKADKDPNAKKSTAKRERKVDEDKHKVFSWLNVMLEGFSLNGEISNLEIKADSKISFHYKDSDYTFTLTKHRTKE